VLSSPPAATRPDPWRPHVGHPTGGAVPPRPWPVVTRTLDGSGTGFRASGRTCPRAGPAPTNHSNKSANRTRRPCSLPGQPTPSCKIRVRRASAPAARKNDWLSALARARRADDEPARSHRPSRLPMARRRSHRWAEPGKPPPRAQPPGWRRRAAWSTGPGRGEPLCRSGDLPVPPTRLRRAQLDPPKPRTGMPWRTRSPVMGPRPWQIVPSKPRTSHGPPLRSPGLHADEAAFLSERPAASWVDRSAEIAGGRWQQPPPLNPAPSLIVLQEPCSITGPAGRSAPA